MFVGRACTLIAGDVLLNTRSLNPGDIAVFRRGACELQEKAGVAAAAGAAAGVITNNQLYTLWSGHRIWGDSEPANPTLASPFKTVESTSIAPSAQ